MFERLETSPIAIPFKVANKTFMASLGLMVVAQQEDKLKDDEGEVGAIERPHPPDRRAQAGSEDVVDDHPDGMADLQRDDGKARKDRHDGPGDGAFADYLELLDAEDVPQRGDDAQPGARDDKKDVDGDKQPPGVFPADIVGVVAVQEVQDRTCRQQPQQADDEESRDHVGRGFFKREQLCYRNPFIWNQFV